MSELAGIDVGTTFTAAAVSRAGRREMVTLSAVAAAAPSVLYLRDDGEFVVGDAAAQRAQQGGDRVAREFKRRMGDPAPVMVGGSTFSAHALTARLLAWTHGQVCERLGGRPELTAVTHPANWGAYRREAFDQAVRMADIGDVITITEPEAAALHYAAEADLGAGDKVAVYDLGGGTFDAAVLEMSSDGTFSIAGTPEGVEQLGGIDFDALLFQHVLDEAGIDLAAIDLDDPSWVPAVAQLREGCVQAKIALSSDTAAVVSVLLPGTTSQVRVTREGLESSLRPMLDDSVKALERALRSAGVEPSDLRSVLLVGGSSRIPLVGQVLGAALRIPVAVDADPKNTIALGAVLMAERTMDARSVASAPAVPPAAPTPPESPMPPAPPELSGFVEAPRLSRGVIVSAVIGLVAVLAIAGVLLTRGGDSEPSTAGQVFLEPETSSSVSPSEVPVAGELLPVGLVLPEASDLPGSWTQDAEIEGVGQQARGGYPISCQGDGASTDFRLDPSQQATYADESAGIQAWVTISETQDPDGFFELVTQNLDDCDAGRTGALRPMTEIAAPQRGVRRVAGESLLGGDATDGDSDHAMWTLNIVESDASTIFHVMVYSPFGGTALSEDFLSDFVIAAATSSQRDL